MSDLFDLSSTGLDLFPDWGFYRAYRSPNAEIALQAPVFVASQLLKLQIQAIALLFSRCLDATSLQWPGSIAEALLNDTNAA